MKTRSRVALLAAVLAAAAAMSPGVPAQAASGTWEYAQSPSLQINETFFMHKHVAGHVGNWHMIQIYVDRRTARRAVGSRTSGAPPARRRRRTVTTNARRWAATSSTTGRASR